MTEKFQSQYISKHLYITMLVIIITVLLISITMIVGNYQKYKLSHITSNEIKSLKMAAELAHLISRERAPANKLMSSSVVDLPKYKEELRVYRQTVDDYILQTRNELVKTGFLDVAKCLDHELKIALEKGRQEVDDYSSIPIEQRNLQQMDQAILAMYHAWDTTYIALKHLVKDSEGRNSNSSDYYALILILADLRDQAGRVASNVMPAIAFNQPIPQENLARSLQTQRQTQYLWQMIDVIQPENRKSARFNEFYQNVNNEFLQKGIPLVQHLIDDSLEKRPYSLSALELTDQIAPKFLTVIGLQDYVLEQSLLVVEHEKTRAQQGLLFAMIVALIGLIAIIIAMIYTKHYVFNPLIKARILILELILNNRHKVNQNLEQAIDDKSLSLLQAIDYLKLMLRQRDDFEFQLQNIANSDAMTGVGNRLALEEYIKYMHQQPNQFYDTCLLVLDIDYFKQVNDQHGHLIGDEAIKKVASVLKNDVRSSDFVVRYGGDEFLVLLHSVSLNKALMIAEQLRLKINKVKIKVSEVEDPLSISVSIGVADGHTQWEDLMKSADQALLKAKANGRNCVISSE